LPAARIAGSGGQHPGAPAWLPVRSDEGIVIAEKEEKVVFEGEVVEAFRSGMYRVALDNGHEALAYTAGRMRRHRIRILLGDRIKLELSPYDLTRGRIVYRHRTAER
jgi:translation initiation factor IF-1